MCVVGVGVSNASEIADLFPAVSPEIVVREARLEDCWEVAETHCSSFFPGHSFPLDIVLRVDRLMGMIMGFSVPPGCQRICLVAVVGSSVDEAICIGSQGFKIGAFDAKISLSKGYVAGILTVDTVADYLPRKGPLRQRRFAWWWWLVDHSWFCSFIYCPFCVSGRGLLTYRTWRLERVFGARG